MGVGGEAGRRKWKEEDRKSSKGRGRRVWDTQQKSLQWEQADLDREGHSKQGSIIWGPD